MGAGSWRASWLIAAAVAALVGLATPAHATADCAALPTPDFAPMPPPRAAGYAGGFAGVWQGVWIVRLGDRGHVRHDISCARLYVSVLGPQEAVVTYCYAAALRRRLSAHCLKVRPQLTGNRLAFTMRSGLNYTFTLSDGVLDAAAVNLADMSSAVPRYARFCRLP